MKLRYNLKNGYITACGYDVRLAYEIEETTPFKTIEESLNWRYDGGWVQFDASWVHDFPIKITIPETVILDNEFYTALIGHVKYLISIGSAAQDILNGNRILYFNALLPEHENLLKNDINIKIEKK